MGVRIAAILLSVLMGISPEYRQALELFDAGMYERARVMFAALPDDAMSDGYELLCALKMKSDDSEALLSAYENKYTGSSLSDMIYYQYAIRISVTLRQRKAAPTRG